MSDVPAWSMFAYRNEDDDVGGVKDAERRMVAEWQIEDVFRWARFRGYDVIMFTRQPETVAYQKARPAAGVRHSSD